MFDEELLRRTRPLLSGVENVEEKRIFGGLAFLVNGNMAVAVSGRGGLMVRVPPERQAELLAEHGAAPMEMRGHAAEGWLRVDAGAVEDDDELAHWVRIGVDRATSLPPK